MPSAPVHRINTHHRTPLQATGKTKAKHKRVSLKVLVKGRVQGVSFRASLHEKCLRNRVDGWVRNRSDGAVEALLQGDEESVRKVVEWARVGPPRAEVSSLKEEVIARYPRQSGLRIIG